MISDEVLSSGKNRSVRIDDPRELAPGSEDAVDGFHVPALSLVRDGQR